jgi:hypothetical protein
LEDKLITNRIRWCRHILRKNEKTIPRKVLDLKLKEMWIKIKRGTTGQEWHHIKINE